MNKRSILLFTLVIFLTETFLTGSRIDAAGQPEQQGEEEAVTEWIREKLETVLQNEDILGDSFELVDMVRATESDDWPDGYCLEIRYTGEGGEDLSDGEICFFQDGQADRTELGRLDHYQFNRWSPRLEVGPIGHYSRLAKFGIPGVKDENALGEYRGAYVKDGWIGDFHLPELALENDQFLYIDMINRILDSLPASISGDPDFTTALETQQIILNALLEEAASLPEQYGFTEHTTYMDSWAGAEVTYCFDGYARDAEGPHLYLFRDQAEGQTADLRLQQLQEFNFWEGELLDQDLLEGYDGSKLIADEYNPSVFYLLFAEDEWIGYLDYSFADQRPHYEAFEALGQAIYKALQSLPEDLPLQETKTDAPQMTETQQILLNALMEQLNNLPEQYGITEHTFYKESWAGAELSYIFDVYAEGVEGAQLILFRDQAVDQTTELRLQQVQDIVKMWGEELDQDVLSEADGSKLISDISEPCTYFIPFVKDEWVGYFNFHLPDREPDGNEFDFVSTMVFKALDQLPEDLPLQTSDLLFEDVLGGSWYTDALPEGYRLGPVFRFDDIHDSHQFITGYLVGHRVPQQYIFYQGRTEPVGEIHYYQELDYFTRLAEKSFDSNYFNCSFDGYADHKCCAKFPYNELVSDPDVLLALWTIGDGSERFIFYNLKVEGLVALIYLYDEEDIAVAEAIGKVIADATQEPQTVEFYSWDEAVDEAIWRCFPTDDEMLLSDMMPAYVRSIQYSSEGYTYRMNYFDQNQPVAHTKIILRSFPYQPSRMTLDFLPKIDDNLYYSFAKGTAFDPDIQYYMRMPNGNHIVELYSKVFDFSLMGNYFPYGWLEDPDNTTVKDIYTQLSAEMNTCLSAKLDIYPITVPGEVSEEALDESYLRELIILTDGYTIPDQGSDATIDSSVVPSLHLNNWQAHGIYLELFFSRELTAPLTYAIYNVRYDTTLYLQQNKYTLGGDHLYTRLTVDRDDLFEGEHILLIWMGDTLIGYEPFNMFVDEEGYH